MSKPKDQEKPISIGKAMNEYYKRETKEVSFDRPVVDIDAFVKANKELSQGEGE